MFNELVAKRCRLRAFHEADLQTFADYRSDPDVARYQSWSGYSYDDALALYRDLTGKPFGLHGHWYQIAVADLASDRLLGDLALHVVDPGTAEVGMTIAPAFQRQGYGREALLRLLAYLFTSLRYERVVAVTDTRNAASIAVLESAGFERGSHIRTVQFKGATGHEYDYVFSKLKWLSRSSQSTWLRGLAAGRRG